MGLILYSDGGGQSGGSGAGACILRTESGEALNLLIFLGGATNNEAEISSGLIGFAALEAGIVESVEELIWVSDSEYTLKSATAYINNWQRNGWQTSQKKPVKNQGLWKSYLVLSRGIKVKPQHVKGHSGHLENELCDQACTWAQASAEEWLDLSGPGVVSDTGLEETWCLLDGRPFIENLRDENVAAGLEELRSQVALAKDFQSADQVDGKKKLSKAQRSMMASMKDLQKIIDKLEKEAHSDEGLNRFLEALVQIQKEFVDGC